MYLLSYYFLLPQTFTLWVLSDNRGSPPFLLFPQLMIVSSFPLYDVFPNLFLPSLSLSRGFSFTFMFKTFFSTLVFSHH